MQLVNMTIKGKKERAEARMLPPVLTLSSLAILISQKEVELGTPFMKGDPNNKQG
jgi:hypothetical protein